MSPSLSKFRAPCEFKRKIEGLQSESPAFQSWLSVQVPGTRKIFSYNFMRYWCWLQQRTGFRTPDELLRDFEGLNVKEQYRHLDWLKEFILSLDAGSRYRKSVWSAVKSFYLHHRLPLPLLNASERREMFRSSPLDVSRVMNASHLSREDVRNLILACNEPYRTIILLMFQSGMGLAEFMWFNVNGYQQIKDVNKEPLQVQLYRVKTSGEKIRKYYTFIGCDGVEALKRWLARRERITGKPLKEGEPIFICWRKGADCWTNVKAGTIRKHMLRSVVRAALIPENRGRDYYNKFHPHELRDAFKSICSLSGVSPIASEFFLGHTIDVDGYDKSPWINEEFYRREYLKAEPMLNILSNPGDQQKLRQQDWKLKQVEAKLTELSEELARRRAFEEYILQQLKQKQI